MALCIRECAFCPGQQARSEIETHVDEQYASGGDPNLNWTITYTFPEPQPTDSSLGTVQTVAFGYGMRGDTVHCYVNGMNMHEYRGNAVEHRLWGFLSSIGTWKLD